MNNLKYTITILILIGVFVAGYYLPSWSIEKVNMFKGNYGGGMVLSIPWMPELLLITISFISLVLLLKKAK